MLSAPPSGADLAAALRKMAQESGKLIKPFLSEVGLSKYGVSYLENLERVTQPKERTIARIRKVLAGGTVSPPNARAKPSATGPAPRAAGDKIKVLRRGWPRLDADDIERLRQCSAARMARSRMAHAPDSRGRKGQEILILPEIWSAIEREAQARGAPAVAIYAEALRLGLRFLEEERFEAEREARI